MKVWWALVAVVVLVGCGGDDDGSEATPVDSGGLLIGSDSFQQGGTMEESYTCVGGDQSPPLTWLQVPEGTESFALVMDDLDADFVHWVIYDIPGETRELPIDLPVGEELDNGVKQGKNSFGDVGYGGPCPPEGQTHTYRFRIFALDEELELASGLSAEEVLSAVEGHVLDEGQLTAMGSR